MINEIKEIIEYLKNPDFYVEDFGFSYKRISLDETNILLDYITNLQQRIDKATDYLLINYVRGLLGDNEVNNVVKILRGDE